MKKLSNTNLKQIKGGAVNWGLWAGISGVASFIIGLIDGFVHTKKCNS